MFDTVVFSGGGNRSFWQAGFWQHLAGHLPTMPKRVLSVSAGAYVAAGVFSGRMQALLDSASTEFGKNRRNFYLSRLLSATGPFPHPPIYRRCLADNLDWDALEVLRQAPPIHVITAAPPTRLPLAGSLALSSFHYFIDKFLTRSLHTTSGRRIGFSPVWHRMQHSATPAALVDLICASSSVVPVFPVPWINGQPALDGGYIDNNPLPRPHEFPETLGRTLVLLTRRYRQLPAPTPQVHYVQPSQKLPVSSFDATAAQGVRDAYAAGERDAERFVMTFEAKPGQ